MAWTAPKTFTVGEVLTAATMNEQVRDNLKTLRRMAKASVSGFNNSGFNYIGAVTASFDDFSAEFGTSYGWGSAGTEFTCPEAGRYCVAVYGKWSGGTGNVGGDSGVRVDHMRGGSLLETIAVGPYGWVNGGANAVGFASCLAEDEFEIAASNVATGTAGSQALRITVTQHG